MTEAVYFDGPESFRAWLAEHHATARELIVGYHKKHTGKPSLDWPQSVDQALCFGWIDGIRRRVDEDRFTIRFTPRKRDSNWSAVNIRRMAELEKLGLVQPSGRAAFALRQEAKSGAYAYENRPADLPEQYEAMMRENAVAWAFWDAQPKGYRRTLTWWIVSAKREETRQKRMGQLIAECAAGRRFGLLGES